MVVMTGYCEKLKKDVLIEAECYFYKEVDLTCCRYWRNRMPLEHEKGLKIIIQKDEDMFIAYSSPPGIATQAVTIFELLDNIKECFELQCDENGNEDNDAFFNALRG
jgi:predicted RNase H-like HicB family nuclease